MKNQLEIHHVSVSGGDATIIAVYDPKKLNEKDVKPTSLVLVDAGNSLADMRTIVEYSDVQFGQKKFSHAILSHAHKDHIGALDQKGDGFEIAFRGGHLEYNPVLAANKIIKVSQFIKDSSYLDLGHNVKIYFICVDAFPEFEDYVHPKFSPDSEEVTDLIKKHNKFVRRAKDDNDLSLAFILNFGDFNYFSAGDISGSEAGGYINVEAELLKLMSQSEFKKKIKKIAVMKASHHGSRFSNYGKDQEAAKVYDDFDSPLLKEINPEHVIIPCNNRIPLPHHEFFGRLEKVNSNAKIYLVNELSRSLDMTDAGKYLELKDEWKNMIETKKHEFKNEITLNKKKILLDYIRNYKSEDIYKVIQDEEDLEKNKKPSIQINLPVVKIAVKDKDTTYELSQSKMLVYMSPERKRKISFGGIPKKLDKGFIDNTIDINDTNYDRDHRGKSYLEVLMMILEIDHSNRLEIINTYKANSDDSGKNYTLSLEKGVNQALFTFAEFLGALNLNTSERERWYYQKNWAVKERFQSFFKRFSDFKSKSLTMKNAHKKKRKMELDKKKSTGEKPTKRKKKEVKKKV